MPLRGRGYWSSPPVCSIGPYIRSNMGTWPTLWPWSVRLAWPYRLPGSYHTPMVPRPLRVLAIAMILFEGMTRFPFYCSPRDSLEAIMAVARGEELARPPLGCRYNYFRPKFCHYEWADYSRALDHVRRTTNPRTEVANVLRQPPFPSMNGPAGRLSPFRAESGICWMWLIDVDLDAEFAEALEQTPDSIVVWSPAEVDEQSRLKLERLTDVIRRCYRPEIRFGPIEIWRRSPSVEIGPTPMPGSPTSSGSRPAPIAVAPAR